MIRLFIQTPKKLYSDDKTTGAYLKEQALTFTVDGTARKIEIGDFTQAEGDTDLDKLINTLNEKLADEFGTGKVTVGKNAAGDGVEFAVQRGSTMAVEGAMALGFKNGTETTYVDTGKTLGDILGEDVWKDFPKIEAVGKVTLVPETSKSAAYYKDSQGNRVAMGGDGKYYRVDENNNDLYSFEINGKQIGAFSKDTALESVLTAINNNTDAGVNVSYSKLTNQFKFTAQETGVAGNIEIGGGLAEALFGGGTATDGKDAVLSMSVNGVEFNDISRSSNSFEVDGLTINVKGTFNYEGVQEKSAVEGKTGVYYAASDSKNLDAEGYIIDKNGNRITNTAGREVQGIYVNEDGYFCNANGVAYGAKISGDAKMIPSGDSVLVENPEAVTFDTTTDSDKIVDAIKAMIKDYNTMATEIKNAYSTLPSTKSNGSRYEPLTDEDIADMSETAVEAYEKKAKQGILFGDNDLSALYSKLLNAISPAGQDGANLKAIGITTSYSDGITTLSLDEETLRSVLGSDPEKVKDTFTKSVANGASSNGLMQSVKNVVDTYAKTTGEKGILINLAGSVRAPTTISQNRIQDDLDEIDAQIEKWQDKLEDRIDYYTSQFTQLEQLISEMNAQSMQLMSFMGMGTSNSGY